MSVVLTVERAAWSAHVAATREAYGDAIIPVVKGNGYGFGRHMGYSTRAHFAAIREHGPSPVHRRSFAPVRAAVRGAFDPQLRLGALEAE